DHAWLSCAAQNMKKMALLLHQSDKMAISNLYKSINSLSKRLYGRVFIKLKVHPFYRVYLSSV
ncbi:MAG: hypothetical protein VB009_03615, partial [Erysipelotrichaceae bacterium]|nr:hypothetical protein [Erysipelotrichaceae bacterium]MEA5017790.1 hypothetical protein [Erysipelotrichaceae bacterium]